MKGDTKMGYESRFYVVEKSNCSAVRDNGLYFASIIAIFDMSKMDYYGKTAKLVGISPDTDCYIYSDDGNTRIIEDSYGAKLKDVDFDALIKCLKSDYNGYRRIPPFIAFLEAIDKSQWDDIVVLHYGY